MASEARRSQAAKKPNDGKQGIPAFVVSPACNHDPGRGRIELSLTPAFTEMPRPMVGYLRCIHCGKLMGTIGPIGNM